MASIRERYARITKRGKADIAAWKASLEKAVALGVAGAAEELRLLNHYEARARRDYRAAPKRKAA
ncbi:hypothetical protein MARCHEWKA_04670 [Brevundimonas phage vB_BpoS-Marchewka]|uniref:Uncharacterized protein n=1 Tax=Brevundimonas phage vB_BpoS-Marchewka TaxID=2948604 RepID=A0A9E7N5Z3_9CAUD|nr:hypothetical protein MARCHEWKA_04670 [Brevundimonas phage vB_BpoS-Marchewka]